VTWSTGARYFHPDYGLMAGRLADDVQAAGPLMIDTLEGKIWTYDGGVWRRDLKGRNSEVRRRAVRLLGERYRPAHARTLTEVLGAKLERFTVGPRPGLINLADGLLRWDADPDPLLLEHNAEEPSTVQLPVPWVPRARAPLFDAFLESALPPDDIERAWEVLGYLMMSGNPLQRMFLLSGSGGNGKGVFLNVARALLGSDNFAAVNIHDLSGDNHFAAFDLYGKLANICGEIDSTFIEKTARIKELCGDDAMRFEQKGEDGFTEKWWGKALFSANQIPGTSDSSVGWSRRWEVIEFPYAPTKPDPTLSARIVERELPGIAYRAVLALRSLMAVGQFSTGESREKAHREFADKANKVRRWMDDPDSGVVREETGTIFNKGTTLLKAFREWELHDAGSAKYVTGQQKFHELCRQAGLTEVTKRGTRGYYGAMLTRVPFGIPSQDHVWTNYESGAPRTAPPDDPPEQGTLV
jgi:putative DNA primase/helicase